MTETNLQILKRADRERYAALLYAPQNVREALAVLHRFDLEIARIRDLVSEPLPGEIRLQWWRDVISGERRGEGMANPLAAALLNVIAENDLPVGAFDLMLEGRIADLYDDPFPSRADLEAYLGETRSALFQLMAQVTDRAAADRSADASGHAGCALGVAQILRQAAQARLRGQVFISEDILVSTGGSAQSWLEGSDTAFLARAVEAFCAFGREHLKLALLEIAKLPKPARPAYLTLAIVEPVLSRAEKMGAAVASEPLIISPLTYQWSLLRMAARL